MSRSRPDACAIGPDPPCAAAVARRQRMTEQQFTGVDSMSSIRESSVRRGVKLSIAAMALLLGFTATAAPAHAGPCGQGDTTFSWNTGFAPGEGGCPTVVPSAPIAPNPLVGRSATTPTTVPTSIPTQVPTSIPTTVATAVPATPSAVVTVNPTVPASGATIPPAATATRPASVEPTPVAPFVGTGLRTEDSGGWGGPAAPLLAGGSLALLIAGAALVTGRRLGRR